jgi:ParB-like chromosome segregation protein Spo0J
MQTVPISQVKNNPRNPRVIRDEKFELLKNSIQEFSEMLQKRPLVCFTDVDGKYVVLGGNMRLKACKEVGLKTVPILLADDWTEEQKTQFVIKDNASFGEWDFDDLAANYDVDLLTNWGVEFPAVEEIEGYEDKNKEIDIDEIDEVMTIKLNYSFDEYQTVKQALAKVAATPEQAVWRLIQGA